MAAHPVMRQQCATLGWHPWQWLPADVSTGPEYGAAANMSAMAIAGSYRRGRMTCPDAAIVELVMLENMFAALMAGAQRSPGPSRDSLYQSQLLLEDYSTGSMLSPR